MKFFVSKTCVVLFLLSNFHISFAAQSPLKSIYYQEIQEAKESDPYIKKRKTDIDIPIVKSCLNWIDVIKQFEKRGEDPSFTEKLKDYGFLQFINFFIPRDMILLKEENAPSLFESIKKHSTKLNVPMPLVFLSEDENLYNAGASSISHNYSLMIIGEKMLKDLSRDEFDAVIAHELSHIKKNHIPKLLLLSAPVAITLNGLLMFYWFKLIYNDFKNNKFYRSTAFKFATLSLASVAFTVVLSKVSRIFEKQADLTALNALDDPDSIIKLMEKFELKIDNKVDNEFDYLFDRIESEMNDSWLKDSLEDTAENNCGLLKFFEKIFKPMSFHPDSKTRKEYLKKQAEKLKLESQFVAS